MAKRSEKASWLIDAAKQLFHQQGFYQTTLADIALKAKVPLGNIYYYFKTKEELGAAVLAQKKSELLNHLSTIDSEITPLARLIAFIQRNFRDTDELSRFGSANGNLAEEFNRHLSPLAVPARELFFILKEWVSRQFIDLGNLEVSAEQKSLQLLATLQGIKTLSLCFQDPNLPEQLTEKLISELN